MNYFNWDSDAPPMLVPTTLVEPTATWLKPAFRFFRTSYACVRETPLHASAWNAFPGIYACSPSKLLEYAAFITDNNLLTTTAYARGHLDCSVLVCGVAPGSTKKQYHESMWLLGPSSVLLRKALAAPVYFTNISWNSFPGNAYDEVAAEAGRSRFEEELRILKPKTVIFLGKYSVYRRVQIPTGVRVLQVYHPSYIARFAESDTKVRGSWTDTLLRASQPEVPEMLSKAPSNYLSTQYRNQTLFQASPSIFVGTGDELQIRSDL